MEVDCKEYRPLESDSNYIEVLDFEFSALWLLYKSDDRDENVTPCFISADVTHVTISAVRHYPTLAKRKFFIKLLNNLYLIYGFKSHILHFRFLPPFSVVSQITQKHKRFRFI